MRNHIRQFGLVALLVFVLGQVGVLIHAVAVEHQPGEVCQTCIGNDRLADAFIAADNTFPVVFAKNLFAVVAAVKFHGREPGTVRARDPPIL